MDAKSDDSRVEGSRLLFTRRAAYLDDAISDRYCTGGGLESLMPKIAISYRRADSQDITGRIFDRLVQRFGKQSIFRDIDNIRPGIDFREQIEVTLQNADVLLAIVGPKWLGRQRGADSRIDSEADWVRIELETALARKIPVVPVLVGGTNMPTTSQLPDSIKQFAFRQAIRVDSGRDFEHHIHGLCQSLDELSSVPASTASFPQSRRRGRVGAWRYALWSGLFGGLVAVLAVGALNFGRGIDLGGKPKQAQINQVISSKEIFNRYADSAVLIGLHWRMFDDYSGKPLFHKVVRLSTGELVPTFVKLPNDNIVRWLTIEDPEGINLPVGGEEAGSGFVVSDTGFILTNKHIAAPWLLPYTDIGVQLNNRHTGLLYSYSLDKKGIEFSPELTALSAWIPEESAYVFDAHRPLVLDGGKDNRKSFRPQADTIIRFPSNSERIPGLLVRRSIEANVALIRVAATRSFNAVELAAEDEVEVGEKIFLLSYGIPPMGSAFNDSFIPKPTVAEGIISIVADAKPTKNVDFLSAAGDAFGLNLSWRGSEGGPVFNSNGRVVGLFDRAGPDRARTVAVPIKYGKMLLNPQRVPY